MDEEIVHECLTLLFQDPGSDVQGVICHTLSDVEARVNTAIEGIGCTVDQMRDAGIHNGACAHWAWLYGNIKPRVRQTPFGKKMGGGADDIDFCVAGGVEGGFAAVVVSSEYDVFIDEDGTDGDLSFVIGFLCFVKCDLHIFRVCHGGSLGNGIIGFKRFSGLGRDSCLLFSLFYHTWLSCCRLDAKRRIVWDKNDCVLLFFSRCTMPVEAALTAELREPVKSSCRLNKIPISIFPITLGLC